MSPFQLFLLSVVVMALSLPDPESLPESDVVIFDGNCNFCRGGVEQIRRMDLGGKRLSYLSLHDSRVAERYPDLSHEQLMNQMYIVSSDDKRHGGSEAVKYLSRCLPLLWPVMPILHLPGTASAWNWLYHQVAKRRYRIAGKADSCNGDACEIHLK